MLVRHKSYFNTGLILALTFLGVLILIFSPLFDGKNGLQYADDLFNKLSKGSSYFIPMVTENANRFQGQNIDLTVKLSDAKYVEKAVKMVVAAGGQIGAKDAEVKVSGDLGKLLAAALRDSDSMYHNKADEVASRYGIDGQEVMRVWWNLFTPMVKELQKQKKIGEANIVSETIRRAIEPAYNFFGIEAQRVVDKAFTVIFLLLFYVAYTMWWGYAVYYLFDGIGLTMKKAKVRKEV
ncbi:MAG: hypothetical protein GX443_14230 [Deltaproteobacteria bacterium]|nr:hypothetical protein [Deltaproteobacteria bacterium]